jgi:hypothetical protein
VNAEQGEVAVNDPDVFRVLLLELRQHGRKASAGRSLEVAVFNNRDSRCIRAENPIVCAHWRE